MRHDRAPLFETVLNHAKNRVVSFHTPGHKNGRGIDRRLRQFTGRNLYYMDVTVFPEVDSLHDPVGPIKKAQQLMAMAYGVEHSFFLVNGSSVANMIMLMSACRPGDSVIISRNAHKSTMAGVILSGVWPIWIQPKVDQNLDILFDSSPEQIEEALRLFPEAKAVFVTSPTYNGVTADLVKIKEICRARGKILLVDEAHGPHLKFHKDLPVSAVEAGADMCGQSTHKILSALSQGSVVHLQSDLIDVTRVRKVVSLLQTTSPNYLILSSLDAARRQAVLEGERILERVIRYAENARKRINQMKNVNSFSRNDILARGYDLDVTKLTVNVTRTGLSGHEIEDILAEKYKVQVDAADLFNLIAIMGIGSDKSDVDRLVDALADIDHKYKGGAQNWVLQIPELTTEMVMNPRDVFLMQKSKRVPLSKAVGQISAQTLTPYPPGIPVLIPGERITKEIVNYLADLSDKDIRVVGQEGDALRTIKVVAAR
ncbi:MAG: aminotransferase class I/II-fold pyridoxal phosphate-dependent enzyme [Elusimicrobia bacterium]|nr:aminotransferase class I/II-fold pyridoxal phosphate-dependent enzyme [Elusimicrobiota bacterium]MBP9699013.1 aminotransferase class I/II-fold pyridoxal phosphate-dependent enzyme [Elusimicrobiota bacterium]